jgi:Short C-terminal domain/Phospholipase_D-nuclease N-terminal
MLIADADFPFLEFLWAAEHVDHRGDGDPDGHDITGWGKAGWTVFIIVLPFLGVLSYLITQHEGMRERSAKHAQAQQQAFDRYVRDAAGGSAAEIAKAKELLDAGTITQAEFDAIKAKAVS